MQQCMQHLTRCIRRIVTLATVRVRYLGVKFWCVTDVSSQVADLGRAMCPGCQIICYVGSHLSKAKRESDIMLTRNANVSQRLTRVIL